MKTFDPADGDAYKALARSWAATVNIVTARQMPGQAPEGVGELDGFTATGFLTVSIQPPIIVVSATNGASSQLMLQGPMAFAVNLLAPGQDALANAFAKPQAERPHLWNEIAWRPDASGAPLIEGAAGAFSARVRQLIPAGDHTLVLGDVTAIHLNETGQPETLVYHNRGYGHFRRVHQP